MAATLTDAEAKLLLKCKDNPARKNYAELLAVELGMNSSYVAGLIRRMELRRTLQTAKTGKRKIVVNVDKTAVKQAEQQQQQQQQQEAKSM